MTNRSSQRRTPAAAIKRKSPARGKATATARDTDAHNEAKVAPFPVVGIGASAGGLEAFTELLKHLPTDTGMGFVLVQHLDPQHESALTQLLGRATSLPVHEVTNNLRVAPNRVHIIPPNTSLTIVQGVLKLKPRSQLRTPTRSIDTFFESLAEDQRERAIGVILSGTATDGTLGLEAIKAEGGITFAQDDSARYDSMPRSAVAAGCVDFVLSPANIARELGRIANHPFVAARPGAFSVAENERESATAHANDATPLPSGGYGTPPTGGNEARAEAEQGETGTIAKAAENGFRKILLLLRNHSGVDFSLYKSTTIQRRILRRMLLGKHVNLESYANFLRGNTQELNALYTDTLISVTSFFRNPEAFDVLTGEIFPKLLALRGNDPIRVWVLGCSTGQEAYSIAMSFIEAMDKASRMRTLQVFATDLNEALLDKARHGLYAKSLAQDVAPERLRRFFVEEEGGYRIAKPLREMVVFARQNLISDPPFSRMDLISCRNLLIYLEPSLQKKLLPTFHYALKSTGFLFLGASESIGGFTGLFDVADKKYKIYTRKSAPTPSFQLPLRKDRTVQPAPRGTTRPALPSALPGPPGAPRVELSAQREADRITVNQFSPPGVLINADLQILQFRGPTGAFLEPPSGNATFDVLKMAREGLMLPLRAVINKAKKEHRSARRENVRIDRNGESRTVNLEVIPLRNLPERCYLILFEDASRATHANAGAKLAASAEARGRGKTVRPGAREESRRISDLESELAETRDYLQSVQEQYEAANEELQASSEEVQSANEELQSINEELETSKEELESANEELTTINEEMANRNVELTRANSDLGNLQTATRLAIVLLGRDQTIRSFSTQAGKQFNLRASDIGRPIGHVRHNLVFAPHDGDPASSLDDFIAEVIDSVRERDREVQDQDGRWYSLRVRPYLTLDNKVDGAVLVTVDIGALKHNEQAIAEARDYAEGVVRTVRDPLLVLDADMRVHAASASFCAAFKVAPAEVEGRLIYRLGNGEWDLPRLHELLEDILPRNSFFNDFEVTQEFDTIGRRTMLLNGRTLRATDGEPTRILLGITDVTEQLQFQAATRLSHTRYQALVQASAQTVWTTDDSGVVAEDSPSWRAFTGQTYEQWKGSGWLDALHPDDRDRVAEAWRRAVAARKLLEIEYRLRQASGDWRWTSVRAVPVQDSDGKLREWVGMNIDITERKQVEDALRESEERFRTLFAAAPMALFVCDQDAVIQYYNHRAAELWGREPARGVERHCGSVKLWLPNGARLPHEQSPIVEVLRTGIPARNVEVLIERPDGSRLPVLANFAPLMNANGEITGTITSFVDITEQKETADALQRVSTELVDADRHKNEFLAVLAHELRNPLAPIRNALSIMRRATQDAGGPVQPAVDMMERQVGQLVRLVDDLLDISRISHGHIELRRKRVELASAVHHAVEAARPALDGMNHSLTVALPPQAIYVDADPSRLAQVIGNLLSNACKFTDRGGRIELIVERDGEQAVIRVRDNGIGIAAEQVPRIFDMFAQVDSSMERSSTGLGIGLSLVTQLVALHSGTVQARSAGIGQGSEFIVRLPISLAASAQFEPEAMPDLSAAATMGRVLIVDDNRDAADSIATLLELAGNAVHTAYDGIEALETAATVRPDAMLLDIGLPKLNGYEVARRIREQPWGKRIMLVALTGWGQDQDRQKSRDAGFDAHLVKPVDPAALLKLLNGAPAT